MRPVIVVDTNIFVSALLGPAGASRDIIRGCLEKRYQPLMGTTLFAEYEALMSRSSLFASCRLDELEREKLLNAFLKVCRWITVYYIWRPNLPDESDNHLLELAVAGGADYLVTKNDKDFKQGELFLANLKVMRPEKFLQEVRKCLH